MRCFVFHALVSGWSLLALLPGPALAQWHHPLDLDGGGWWRARIKAVVENGQDRAAAGEPAAIRVGSGAGEAELAGQTAEAVRVCSESGAEMLFALQGPDGSAIRRGPIPPGSTLILPVECPAGKKAAYYVYFDNPAAGEVPDFLAAREGVINGDVESGRGETPEGWTHDAADPQHRAAWSTEHPQSGKRCLKTVVDAGAEPTWIATRQNGIHIRSGAKYRMTAWVKAESVKGFAGWYIHVGNAKNAMLISPMLNGGQGTYDWKEVTAEFTAPVEADQADLGTVLRGTGTAWFDRVSLKCLEPGRLRAVAEKPQRMAMTEIGGGTAWPDGAEDHRLAARVFNFGPQPVAGSLVSLDASVVDARRPAWTADQPILVTDGAKPVPHDRLGSLLLFSGDVPASSVRTWHVSWSSDPGAPESPAAASPGTAAEGILNRANLVRNPGFETAGESPEGWTHDPVPADSGVRFGLDSPGRAPLGRRCIKMEVPATAPAAWRGWRQSVSVRPGKTYLLAAWVKCQDIRGGEVRVHAHKHAADGGLSKHEPMTSVGPGIQGTADWTLMSGLIAMPEDAASLSLHLTTNTTGTVWHDGVVVAEVTPARFGPVEGRPMDPSEPVKVWPVPAIVKVFPEDTPRKPTAARLGAARNEWEPLQLAIRSGRAVSGVRVEVDPPANPRGEKLRDVEVNTVGFVPIDHPTNYYQTRSPAWHRKVPTQAGACDGWPGRWPDPLLPRSTFDLAANATQPVWVTVRVPKDASPGEYSGTVRLVSDQGELARYTLAIRVWNFTLPDESHVGAIYDVRASGGEAFWGKPAAEATREIVAFMARRRLCPDSVQPFPSIKYENGRVTADFREFDRAAAWYFDELKLPFSYTPWYFYLFGWGMPPGPHFGEQPYAGSPPFEGADRSRLRPEFKRAYQACLKAFWDHVKEKGWEKKFILYISDEPFDSQPHIREQMKALCRMIREVDPQIPIYSSTWKHVPEWDGSLSVWGIGHYGIVAPEQMAKIRSGGARVWFTTDGQMCTDTPYCAVERLLPHYCFKYGAQAYEFWGVSWYTYDPFRYGWHAYIHQSDQPGVSYWVRYPNGDGFLLYPGGLIGHKGPVSSIRLEQAREGVEDYEYLHLLRQRIARAKAAGKDVRAAQRAMELADALVTIPNAGGRYSSKILPNAGAVYEVRRAVAEAIERLGP